MAITLSSISNATLPEYAAHSISFNRTMTVGVDGFYVPVFSANIAYSRQEFVVDGDGNKVGMVQPKPFVWDPTKANVADPNNGNIHMDCAAMVEAGLLTETTDAAVFQWLSDKADALIQADLVRRGIL